jgi:zinc protease
VSIQIPVQTGSRNEVEPGKSGFAHFFEHLMFRGTPETPPEKYRQIMTSAGSRDNASTGDDFTRYYATFAKEDLATVLGTYADMFQNLAYSESDFKTEAQAILGEYNKNSAEPLGKLFEVQRERFFQTHTYKHTTMGFIRDIENSPNFATTLSSSGAGYHATPPWHTGDVTAEEVFPPSRSTGVGRPMRPFPSRFPRSHTQLAALMHTPWSSATLPYVSVAFPGRPLTRGARARRRSPFSARCTSARPPSSTSVWSSRSRRSTCSASMFQTASIRRCSLCSRG